MSNPEYLAETELLVSAIRQVRQHCYDDGGIGTLAPYRHILVKQTVGFALAAFHEMLSEHAETLANEINSLGYHIAQCKAWSKVLPSHSVEDQLLLLIECVEATAYAALGSPYALRSRFIFSAAHLCHQANFITRKDWSESRLPKNDRAVDYKTMLAVSDGWKTFSAFKSSLDKLNSEAVTKATGDFRHKYNHRVPPRIAQGQSQIVTRTVHEDGSSSYGFGYVSPLSLAEIAQVLTEQHSVALEVFAKYSELAREQLSVIYTNAA